MIVGIASELLILSRDVYMTSIRPAQKQISFAPTLAVRILQQP